MFREGKNLRSIYFYFLPLWKNPDGKGSQCFVKHQLTQQNKEEKLDLTNYMMEESENVAVHIPLLVSVKVFKCKAVSLGCDN